MRQNVRKLVAKVSMAVIDMFFLVGARRNLHKLQLLPTTRADEVFELVDD